MNFNIGKSQKHFVYPSSSSSSSSSEDEFDMGEIIVSQIKATQLCQAALMTMYANNLAAMDYYVNNVMNQPCSSSEESSGSDSDQNNSLQSNYMVDIEATLPTAFDPFAEDKDSAAPGAKEYVHIRIQQRNGKKSLTTVQGLRKKYSYEKILKDLKKEFCCNGNVVQDKELGTVIQLQGDQRKNVSQFLINAGLVKKDQIKIHGF